MSHANLTETHVEDFGPVLLDQKVAQPDALTTLVASVVFLIVGVVLRLVVCSLFAIAAFAMVEAWERLSTRRKVYRAARLAQERHESGQGPDPAYLDQVTLGPPGFSCRMPQGEFQRPWSTVSRVLRDRGSIIICNAGNALQPETVAVFLPAIAFDDPDRARCLRTHHRLASSRPQPHRRFLNAPPNAARTETALYVCNYIECKRTTLPVIWPNIMGLCRPLPIWRSM